jgi:hypothetical protein
MHKVLLVALGLAVFTASGCKEEELDASGGEKGSSCDPDADEGEGVCADGLSCSPSVSSPGDHICATPYLFRGQVYDALDESPIEGALIAALDATNAPVTDVVESDADGNYELEVPVPRDENGDPADGVKFTLMAQAQDYQPFPAGTRPAIPVSIEGATPEDGDDEDEDPDHDVVENATTEIAMIPLGDDESGGGRVEGTVLGDDVAGALVVAEGFGEPARWASADLSGHYVLFNVPEGSGSIVGYRAGLQIEPAEIDVAGEDVADVDLETSTEGLGSVSGSVQIVNAGGISQTSVVLVPSSVFNENLERGPVPFGLREPDPGLAIETDGVEGAFTVDGVGDGTYKVLAAFENDLLVRDPDESIAGTQILEITIDGDDIDINDGFKITEALAVIGPGKDDPEVVTGTPSFRWDDDSSEDGYHVVLFDALGELVWETDIDGVSGGDVSVNYGGPDLEGGMYYQFRATSMKMGNSISRTEDLRGVFVYGAE